MKIGLDTTWINIPDGGGRYTNEVLRFLCKGYPEHHFYAIGPNPRQSHNYPNLTQINHPDTSGLKRRFIYTVSIASILRKHAIDVFHNLINFGIYNTPCPLVTTVHDVLTLKYPELRSKKVHGWLYRYYIPSLIKKADIIIADSESTKRDIDVLYGLKNVEKIYPGYNKSLFSPHGNIDEKIMDKYNLKPGYLFFVGNVIPKKNIPLIIKAFHNVLQHSDSPLEMVIAGKTGHGFDTISHSIDSLSLNASIRFLGYVPDSDLGALYRQARLFLFPSLYEGFGLPVLEAMACGTPVLASDAGPLPEIVENKKYLCSPVSCEEWATKIRMFLTDDSVYSEAKKWCLEQSRKFSWETCVESYINIYESLVGK